MKALLVSILLYSSTLLANSFEVKAVLLANGDKISVNDETQELSTEEIRAFEIIDENQEYILVTPRLLHKLINDGSAISVKSIRFGGDGSGGG